MTVDRKKIGKKSKSKGDRGERILCKKFASWWGSDFTRTPSSGGFKTKKFREDWNAAGDLVTPDLSFPFCVESKNAEGWHLEQLLTSNKCSLVKYWKQTVEETPEGQIPLLVFTRNHQPHFFMMLQIDWVVHVNNLGKSPAFRLECEQGRTRLVKLGLLDELFSTTPEQWGKKEQDDEAKE
jgi:hypothetical protein